MKIHLVIVLLSISGILSQDVKSTTTPKAETTQYPATTTPKPPVTTTPKQHSTTTPKIPTTVTTTPKPETTTSKIPETTTSTSTTSTTTTLAPNTTTTSTTMAPNTTTSAPNTTTSAPNTTTTAPSTTVAPAPSVQIGRWNVTDPDSNVSCIILEMAAEVKIPYMKIGENKTTTATLVIPKSALATGSCNSNAPGNSTEAEQQISLKWGSDSENGLEVTFSTRNISNTHKYVISLLSLTVNFDNATFPDSDTAGVHEFASDGDLDKLFELDMKQSYKCKATRDEPLLGQGYNFNATLKLSNMQVQAFRSTATKEFGSSVDCLADSNTSDIVPIAVGCALAALVVIVIVAYLIGRRRAWAKGYTTM